MYGVMTLSQRMKPCPGGDLATVLASPQPNRSRSLLLRWRMEFGGYRRAVDADRGEVPIALSGFLAAQASTANGITASSGLAPNSASP